MIRNGLDDAPWLPGPLGMHGTTTLVRGTSKYCAEYARASVAPQIVAYSIVPASLLMPILPCLSPPRRLRVTRHACLMAFMALGCTDSDRNGVAEANGGTKPYVTESTGGQSAVNDSHGSTAQGSVAANQTSMAGRAGGVGGSNGSNSNTASANTGSASGGIGGNGGATLGTSRAGNSNGGTSALTGQNPTGASAGRSTSTNTNSLTGGNAAGGTRASVSTSTGTSGGGTSAGAATGGASGGVSNAIPLSQCRGAWDFEAIVDAKVSDRSGHDRSLTVSQATLAEGPRGNYLRLTGSGSSATASDSVVATTGDFSLSVWAKIDQLSSFSTLVSQDGRSISSFYLQKRSSGKWAFTTFPSDNVDATGCITEAAIPPRVGEWYHLVATRNAATREQRLYVDGMLSGTSQCAGGFSSTSPLVIGRGRWDGEADWASGGVDELCVLDRVMSAADVVDLYRQGRPVGSNYLFAYFAEQAKGRGDGLRLAQSHDALYWGAIGKGKVFLPPTVGGKSFRDPHVMRDPKGMYHVVWTTTCVPWAESGCVQDKGFGHAQSTDLVHFDAVSYVPIDLNVEHVWAPETIYDAVGDQYMVYWSSPIDNSPTAADPHSIYYVLTKDFVAFSKPNVLYSRSGRNFIDATILAQASGYLMFLKDEADGQKNIRALSSTILYGSGAWNTDPSAALTGNYGAEGPSPLLGDGKLYLFFDKFNDGKYGALISKGLSNLVLPATWQDASNEVYFEGVRHGTPIEVPWDA
ncbi:MAG TPA: LamG-like jellyroll fold domain-containing protein [Polyangiaceae bacterium]